MARKRDPVVYRAMTEDERVLARLLGGCSFSIGTFDKRFARGICAEVDRPNPVVTEKQAALLRKLVHTYRRQIPEKALPKAERYLKTSPPGATPAPEPTKPQLDGMRMNGRRGVPNLNIVDDRNERWKAADARLDAARRAGEPYPPEDLKIVEEEQAAWDAAHPERSRG